MRPSSLPPPPLPSTPSNRPPARPPAVVGTLFTSFANVFFALIDPSAPYWAFGFPAAIFSVFGADFVFAAGTLFIAKVALPHEQSVAGALFQTMTQVRACARARAGAIPSPSLSFIFASRSCS